MFCECNETPFNKLRSCWSRHQKKEMQDCCCSTSGAKPKVKGKFGIAYVIDTPNRKCKPCGWEVEFNDTLSEVENNCKKMMNWVTCPPLGECQNNQTNICCCSENSKQFSNNLNQICLCTRKDNLCQCCSKKKETCTCCSKEQRASCCCERPSRNQCICSSANNNKNKCCRQNDDVNKSCSKPKCMCCCCKPKEIVQKCTECCCTISNNNKNSQYSNEQYDDAGRACCCQKIKKPNNCCCQESDSQSSLDSCECNRPANKKNCNCNCNNSRTKSASKSKRTKRKNHKKNGEPQHNEKKGKAQSKQAKDHTEKIPHTSKNLMGPEPKKERYKAPEKTPFTITNHEEPKKEPDKNEKELTRDFHNELAEKILARKKPEENIEEITNKPINDLKVIMDQSNSKTEIDSPEISIVKSKDLERDVLLVSKTPNTSKVLNEKDEIQEEIGNDKDDKGTGIEDIVYEDRNLELNESPVNEEEKEYVNNNLLEESTNISKDENKEVISKKENISKKPTLLQRIKQERQKEMEAIGPKPQRKDMNTELMQPKVTKPQEIPKPKITLGGPALLKKIRQQRRKEMEAIHPEIHRDSILFENVENPNPSEKILETIDNDIHKDAINIKNEDNTLSEIYNQILADNQVA